MLYFIAPGEEPRGGEEFHANSPPFKNHSPKFTCLLPTPAPTFPGHIVSLLCSGEQGCSPQDGHPGSSSLDRGHFVALLLLRPLGFSLPGPVASLVNVYRSTVQDWTCWQLLTPPAHLLEKGWRNSPLLSRDASLAPVSTGTRWTLSHPGLGWNQKLKQQGDSGAAIHFVERE